MTDTMTNLKNGLCPECGKSHTMSPAQIEEAMAEVLADHGLDCPECLDGIVCDPCFLREVCSGDVDYFVELLNRKPRDRIAIGVPA
jgi:hypothetical protein